MKTPIVLYMPALHQGCINFIVKYGGLYTPVFLISELHTKEVNPETSWIFEKYLHAMPAIQIQKALISQKITNKVSILDDENLKIFEEVIIPDKDDLVEDILLELYPLLTLRKLPGFIRWGRKTVLSERKVVPNAIISSSDLDKELMIQAFDIAQNSEDWWRQVGVIIKPINFKPIFAFNHHFPHPYAPYIHGDPRSDFKPGEYIEFSTAIHAEAAAIGHAARKGISLEGASIYVTTFPCPNCARLIVQAGIKKVYYCDGYSLLDAMEIFQAARVSLVFVDVTK